MAPSLRIAGRTHSIRRWNRGLLARHFWRAYDNFVD